MGCMAKGILSVNTIKTQLTNYKVIVKALNNHHVANQTLKILQKEKQRKERAHLPAETGWGPATKSLESLLCAKNYFQELHYIIDTVSLLIVIHIQFPAISSVAIKKLGGDPPNLQIFLGYSDSLKP